MSLSAGLPGYKSTDNGLKKTGFSAPILAGRVADGGSSGPIPAAGGVMCVQSTASLTAQVVSTVAAVIGSRASFIYIPVTTGPLNQVTEAPPYVGVGTPLVWDDTNFRLQIWSSTKGTWMCQLSSVGGGYWTTS
jgi:hypothetical protein